MSLVRNDQLNQSKISIQSLQVIEMLKSLTGFNYTKVFIGI